MKKTILGIVTIAMLLVAIFATVVNAAEIKVEPKTMKIGDQVTVTVKTDEPVDAMQFDLKYDNTKYKFLPDMVVSALGNVDVSNNGDTLVVSTYATNKTTSEITLKFEALANGEAIPFTISNTEFAREGEELSETVATPTVTATIAEPSKPSKPVENTNTTTNETGNTVTNETANTTTNEIDNTTTNETTNNITNTTKDTNSNGNKYYDEDGKEITKIAQTGSYIPTIILAVVVLAIVTRIGYNIQKNK